MRTVTNLLTPISSPMASILACIFDCPSKNQHSLHLRLWSFISKGADALNLHV